MSVSVSMPQLGESVTEGTVTRWLKKEGERVEADEPLLEVSTDKVDTEIPSPVSGILRGITVAEDETVAVGAELAVIDDEGSAGAASDTAGTADGPAAAEAPPAADRPAAQDGAQPQDGAQQAAGPPAAAQAQDAPQQAGAPDPGSQQSSYQQQPGAGDAPQAAAQPQATSPYPPYPPASQQAPAAQQQAPPVQQQAPAQQAPPVQQQAPAQQAPAAQAPDGEQTATAQPAPAYPAAADGAADDGAGPDDGGSPLTSGTGGPYVTPLVRKLATEHGVDLAAVAGTGVGGRIRKQDVLDAARVLREPGAAPAAAPAAPAPEAAAAPTAAAAPEAAPAAAATAAAPAAQQAPAGPAAQVVRQEPQAGQAPAARPAIVPSTLRGTTEQMSRARQVIAKRMVESLQTSAQLTTVVEADVTAIARLRDLAKADFQAREGVKLSFLPFFALAAVEALKVHPRLNAVIDTASAQVTYHDAEHLGIAVDTDRGLMVPVIRKAGDLNIGGLARKIADLAQRTRAGRVSPDDLSGGTFTLTNTGSRGALFDTPIINQPQVAILGTGTVVKRPVVVEDPALGEVIAVRSMVYLALTYDHRLVDGADAARFLVTMKSRLEEGAFETELGL
jgi:2-oxoglutarate dehydrogenase E2 component (dihydrolipoamide succinyltransferase)